MVRFPEPLTALHLSPQAWIPAFAGMTQKGMPFPWKRESRGGDQGADTAL